LGVGTNFSLLSGEKRVADMTTGFDTWRIAEAPDAIAPDGSEVRLLGSSQYGSTASFRLQPKAVSRAVAHRTVEEIWYFTGGTGCLWRKLGDHEEIV
jgi:mannose-6-phosphate isomerase-like protein (cupin superfamily)